jgi:hypothetical protein
MIGSADLFNQEFMDHDFGEGQFFCAEGVVAKNEDPENRCRVQCTIKIIDENEIYPIWARRYQVHVGANGYGDYWVPEIGAEVMLQGRFGDTNNLFYAPLYNEKHLPSKSEFPNPRVAGVRFKGDLKFLADMDMKIRAGKALELIGIDKVQIKSDVKVEVIAPGGLTVNGRPV